MFSLNSTIAPKALVDADVPDICISNTAPDLSGSPFNDEGTIFEIEVGVLPHLGFPLLTLWAPDPYAGAKHEVVYPGYRVIGRTPAWLAEVEEAITDITDGNVDQWEWTTPDNGTLRLVVWRAPGAIVGAVGRILGSGGLLPSAVFTAIPDGVACTDSLMWVRGL